MIRGGSSRENSGKTRLREPARGDEDEDEDERDRMREIVDSQLSSVRVCVRSLRARVLWRDTLEGPSD